MAYSFRRARRKMSRSYRRPRVRVIIKRVKSRRRRSRKSSGLLGLGFLGL